MALALWAGWSRLQEGGRRAPPPLTISTLVPVPMATLRLAYHRPIQSVYWHCPIAPPECIHRPADAFWHLCILPRRLASALSVLLSFTLLRLNLDDVAPR